MKLSMKLTMFILAVAVAFSSAVLSGKATKKIPEGVELKGDDRAVAKAGYQFSRVNELQAQSHAVASEGAGKKITGEYTCTCTKGQGFCELECTPTTLTCKPGSQCEKCQLTFTTPREKKVSR